MQCLFLAVRKEENTLTQNTLLICHLSLPAPLVVSQKSPHNKTQCFKFTLSCVFKLPKKKRNRGRLNFDGIEANVHLNCRPNNLLAGHFFLHNQQLNLNIGVCVVTVASLQLFLPFFFKPDITAKLCALRLLFRRSFYGWWKRSLFKWIFEGIHMRRYSIFNRIEMEHEGCLVEHFLQTFLQPPDLAFGSQISPRVTHQITACAFLYYSTAVKTFFLKSRARNVHKPNKFHYVDAESVIRGTVFYSVSHVKCCLTSSQWMK